LRISFRGSDLRPRRQMVPKLDRSVARWRYDFSSDRSFGDRTAEGWRRAAMAMSVYVAEAVSAVETKSVPPETTPTVRRRREGEGEGEGRKIHNLMIVTLLRPFQPYPAKPRQSYL